MSGERLRVAAFGSPAFALPTLERLASEHDLLLVVSQSDKPAGRGMARRSPPAAQWARAHGIALEQPERLRSNAAFVERLRALALDVAVTAAYGKILPRDLLEVPREGFLNVHASLLPRYRGAAPVQWALIEGERETGVSIMQTEVGLDTGPVRHVRRLTIDPDEHADALLDRLAALGAEALSEALTLLARGALPSRPQDHAAATLAPRLTRADGRIRWADGAEAVHARHRGVTPWPGSWFERVGPSGADVLKVHALGLGAPDVDVAPGTVVGIDDAGIHVATARGTVVLRTLQTPGRPRQDAAVWARGARIAVGERCG